MAPTDDSFRSPLWVLAIGRWIDRLGLGRSVALLVAFTVVGSLACVTWFLSNYPPQYLIDGFKVSSIVATAISAPVSFVLCRLLAEVSRSRAAVYRLAHVDELTRAYSRRHFMEAAPGLVASAAGTAIMSGKYGGDLPYASKLIALSTPLSMLTLPFMATLVNRLLQ